MRRASPDDRLKPVAALATGFSRSSGLDSHAVPATGFSLSLGLERVA